MALVVADRVKETTTTTGTGAVTLAGAASGFQSFAAVGNGNTTYYAIVDSATGDWETGVGTYSTTGPTLSRTTVLASSNSNALVNFAAGTKEVFVTYPAERAGTSQIGDIKLASSPPDGPGTWLETGKYYSKSAYPALASVVGNVPDLASVVSEPQAQLPVAFASVAGISASQSTTYITASNGTTTVVVGASGAIRKTADGTNWIPVASTTASSLNECRYINGNFVAVGATGVIVSSTDGTVWTARQSGVTSNLLSVAFGNSRFVVVGVTGVILHSGDLVTWTRVSGTGSNQFSRVIYANGLFVAVGAAGSCFTSTDGITWTSRSAGSELFMDVVYANSLFVACGNNGAIYTSSDGATWTSRGPGTPSLLLNQIIYQNSLFVVVGSGGVIYTSSDGTTWTLRTSGTTQPLVCVCWNGTNYVAGAGPTTNQNGTYVTSPNGATWTLKTDVSCSQFTAASVVNGKTILFGALGASVLVEGATRAEVLGTSLWNYTTTTTSAPNPRTIAYNGTNNYVSVGVGGTLLSSSDASTWTAGTWTDAASTTSLASVYYLNGLYLALGTSSSSNNVVTSSDGLTWTSRSTPVATTYNAAAYGASVWVVVGATSTTNGYLVSSSDGITWTNRKTETIPFYDVTYANGLFVAVGGTGNGSTGSGVCYSSADGVAWTQRGTSSLVGWNRVIYANGLFVVVGQAGRINTSPDAVTWTNRTSNLNATLNDVAWNGSVFCVVGASGQIATSPDGVTWTARTPGDTGVSLMSISVSGSRFVVTNSTDGAVWTSTDGITWTRVSTAFRGAIRYSAYLGGRFVAAGNANFIQSSTDGLTWKNCDHVRYVPSSINKLYKLGSYYYAATNSGLFESPDGIAFSVAGREIPPTSVLSMAYSGTAWLAIISGGSGQPASVYKSTDGTTWSKSADFGTLTANSTSVPFVDVVYGGSNFVLSFSLAAVQNIVTAIQTSSDGATWTARSLPSNAAASGTMASDGSTVLTSVAAPASGFAKSTDGGATWTVLSLGSSGNIIYASGVWLLNQYATTDLTNYINITGFAPTGGVYIHGGKYIFNVPTSNARIVAATNSANYIQYLANITAPQFSPISTNYKEYPARGATLLVASSFSNASNCYLLNELGLYGYDTATTFWVPPQLAGGGQTAYIYAGP